MLGTVVVAAAGLLASGHQLVRTDGDSFWELWVTSAGTLLLLAGGIHLLAHPGARSWPALSTGLVLVLGLWQATAIIDSNFVRDLILAHVSGTILLVGIVFRWQAPVVLGGAVAAFHGATRFLWPWIEPQPWWGWAAIGAAAVLFVAVTHKWWMRRLTRLSLAVRAMR